MRFVRPSMQPWKGILNRHEVEALRKIIGQADNILYLTDNAGEIVFDRLLIEEMPLKKVTLAVKGRPDH